MKMKLIDFTNCRRIWGKAYNRANGKNLLMSGQSEDCNEALIQIVPKIRIEAIQNFLEEVPYLSDLQRNFYLTYIQARLEKLLLPAYKHAVNQKDNMDLSSKEPIQ